MDRIGLTVNCIMTIKYDNSYLNVSAKSVYQFLLGRFFSIIAREICEWK